VEYYLPHYLRLPFTLGSKWEQDEGLPLTSADLVSESVGRMADLQPDASGRRVVVIFDPVLSAFNRTPERVKALPLPGGGQLEYLELGRNEELHFDGVSFGLLPR
jgi:hypothetical protein